MSDSLAMYCSLKGPNHLSLTALIHHEDNHRSLKLLEKFRRFVILVSIRLGWIHLSTLS